MYTFNLLVIIDVSKYLILFILIFSEVFKAHVKNDPKQIVAMKKVLLGNEQEGVSNYNNFTNI